MTPEIPIWFCYIGTATMNGVEPRAQLRCTVFSHRGDAYHCPSPQVHEDSSVHHVDVLTATFLIRELEPVRCGLTGIDASTWSLVQSCRVWTWYWAKYSFFLEHLRQNASKTVSVCLFKTNLNSKRDILKSGPACIFRKRISGLLHGREEEFLQSTLRCAFIIFLAHKDRFFIPKYMRFHKKYE
jgi:hypothetical protein